MLKLPMAPLVTPNGLLSDEKPLFGYLKKAGSEKYHPAINWPSIDGRMQTGADPLRSHRQASLVLGGWHQPSGGSPPLVRNATLFALSKNREGKASIAFPTPQKSKQNGYQATDLL